MLATWFYRNFIAHLLFLLDPEEAHDFVLHLVPASAGMLKVGREAIFSDEVLKAWPRLQTIIAGSKLANPVGVAAGVDKNAKYVSSFHEFDFGFMEIGSVTADLSAGNARPRLFRLPQDQAVINRMGLNGDGAKKIAARLNQTHQSGMIQFPVALNIAKSNLPGLHGQAAVADLLASFEQFQNSNLLYVTINTSCPNTHDGALNEASELKLILQAITAVNSSRFPLFLKLSPDSTDEFMQLVVNLSREFAVAGFVCGNTSVSRAGLSTDATIVARCGMGGLSGPPIRERMLIQVSKVYALKSADQQIIACGGISSAVDVVAAIAGGASAVQLYTALVYHGPFLIMEMLAQLALALEKEQTSVAELVGNSALGQRLIAQLTK